MSIQDSSRDEQQTLLEAAVVSSEEKLNALAGASAPVAVFNANSSDEGEIIRGLLESEGIPALYDAQAGIVMGDAVMIGDSPKGVVLVAGEDEARARELIAAYSLPVTDEEIAEAADASAG